MTKQEILNILKQYEASIDEQFKTGLAREHSYRPALQKMLSDLLPQYVVTNEPAHIDCGAPDYIITKKNLPVFFVEAKDLFDADLDGVRAHKEQFDRYKASLDYVIFTDYLDFHVYEHGEWYKNVRLMEQQGTHLRLISGKEEEFAALIEHLALSHPQTITSSTKLAQQMAAKARLLAEVIKGIFEEEEKAKITDSQLQGQLEAFRDILIHDLTENEFADLYAQTIAYGMFAARLHDTTPENFSRQEAAELIPKTNPFLRQIFQQIAGFDLDERIAWIVDDLAQTFQATNMTRVMKNYSSNALHNDPMIHFYEDFLSAYNPELRKAKGVWYTPQPVVGFIVRAVDEILKHDFHLPQGLADSSKILHEVVNDQYKKGDKTTQTFKVETHRVQILDPATGTGTFLAEVVRQIYQKFNGMQGMWQGYVEDHLLPRLHGFELLMASYAVAHLKLDLQLSSLGFDSSKIGNKRLRIYLTNSLEGHHPNTGNVWAQWLSSEASQANYIKRDCPVMVMIGNPPYSGESQNKGEWITKLMETYKKEPGGKEKLKERNPKWINDDYVKFIRLAQDYVERNGQGVIGFINPHGYLDNPTFRGMRWNLLKTFDKIYTLDLHGNSKKKETCPDGSKDENVFDIMQGVSINIFVKTGEKKADELGKVYHKDLYGLRNDKYNFLDTHNIEDVGYEELQPQAPRYLFIPQNYQLRHEYDKGISITDLFCINSVGVVTSKDSILLSNSQIDLLQKVRKYYDIIPDETLIKRIAYRPFDNLFIYYDVRKIERARESVMRNFFKGNIGLITARSNKSSLECSHFYVSNTMSEAKCGERTTQSSIFPLYLYSTNVDGTEERLPNLNQTEWQKFNNAIGEATTPEMLLSYIYGVLHSPSYRERYKEFLKIDFPRIPLPVQRKEFLRIGRIGYRLMNLHLMRFTDRWELTTTFPVTGDNVVDAISYQEGCVMINSTQYFGDVPEEAWNAYIGGYQPAQKWLKDHMGRILDYDDINHYRHIIHALAETQRLMEELG